MWSIAVMCAGLYASVTIQAYAARHAVHALLVAPPSREHASPSAPAAGQDGQGGFFGELSIPKLSLSVPILPDYDTNSLLRGVGHVKGTALPGGLGNMGLAGHRDTYFRPLRNVVDGMDIRVKDTTGTYHYIVDRTEVVLPDEVSVLDVGAQPELTLITCFPFNYVGAAPKRFIVHAHLVSADADASSDR